MRIYGLKTLSDTGLRRLSRKVLRYALLQHMHQRVLHIRVIVGDIEAVDGLVTKLAAKLFRQSAPMAAFHHQDQLGPLEQFGADGVVSIAVNPSRGGFYPRPIGETLFGGGAAQAVLGANKQHPQWRTRAGQWHQA